MDAEKSSTDQQLQVQLTELQQELAKLKNQNQKQGNSHSKGSSAPPAPKQNQQTHTQPAIVETPPAPDAAESNRGGAASGYNRGYNRGRFRGRGKGQSRLDPDQCAYCDEYGHWASDCKRRPPRGQDEEEVQIKTVSDDKVRGVVEASFREEPVHCVLDTTVRCSVIDQALVNTAAIEPFDEGEVSRDRPAPTAVGRYCAIF